MTQGKSLNEEGDKVRKTGASLVAQWLRNHLPMQRTRVQALVWEDPTCRRADKPVRLEPVLRNKRSHRNEKPTHCKEE